MSEHIKIEGMGCARCVASVKAALEELPERLGVGKRKVFQAVRVAECGNQVSPPLGASMELLGRDASLARLTRAMPLAG